MDPKTEIFLALMKASGWSQAEVARQLHITPGAVSQICSGKILPKAGTLNLFKMILGIKDPEALKAYERSISKNQAWERELVEALQSLPDKDRQRVLVPIKAMIKAMADSLRRKT